MPRTTKTTRIVQLAAALTVTATLSGCGTTFSHPYKSNAEFEQDNYACQKVAEQRAANTGYPHNFMMVQQFHTECMQKEHGWVPER